MLARLAELSGTPALGLTQALALSQKLCAAPDLMEHTLAIMKTFFRDLIVYEFAPEKIVNLDFSDTIADIIRQKGSRICFSWLAELHETEKRLLSNSSPRLAMDRFLLKLAWQKGAKIYD